MTAERRAVFLVFTERVRGGETLIGPVSARFMNARERELYEKILAALEN